jgi:hypothetical protein
MKKDYHYYHKRVVVYTLIAVGLIGLIVCIGLPVLFNFIIVSKDVTAYIQLGLGLTAFSFYMLSRINENKREDIRRAERQQIKKKEFNEILTLTKEGKDDEAYDALCNYRDKYN